MNVPAFVIIHVCGQSLTNEIPCAEKTIFFFSLDASQPVIVIFWSEAEKRSTGVCFVCVHKVSLRGGIYLKKGICDSVEGSFAGVRKLNETRLKKKKSMR